MNKYQKAWSNVYSLSETSDYYKPERDKKDIDLIKELVDKFELIKTISKQNYEDCWKEWIRYGEYEDKGRASAFSQILRLIKDDKDE